MEVRILRKKFLTASKIASLYPLFWVSCLWPRNPKLWVFISWYASEGKEIFSDNSKYLFLHIVSHHKNTQAVWLAKDYSLVSRLRVAGYRSYHHESIKGIWCALRAGTTVIDAYLQPENFRWSGRTRLVQLLHGKGMKKGGYVQKPLRRQDIIFSPSPFVSNMLPPKFVQKTPITVAGYPRNDVFVKEIPGSTVDVDQKTKELLEEKRYNKKILYAPTFRRGQTMLSLEDILDIKSLSEWLAENKHLLIIPLHPKYIEQARGLSTPNIHFLPASDFYPILRYFDLLINDYSSLFADFLLFDKPIIFYPYDLKEYGEKEGLSFPYDDYTPGPKAYTPQELIQTLQKTIEHDTYAAERKRVRDLYHTYQDGNSSERIMSSLSTET